MGKLKQSQNRQRHEFLLTFFEGNAEIKEVNGFILKKYFSNNTHQWEVAIYTKDSYSKAQDYLQQQSHMQAVTKQTSLLE